MEIEEKRLSLININEPYDDWLEFYLKVAKIIDDFNDTCIFCGDFNLVQDQELDTYNHLHINKPRAKDCVLSIKEELYLVDPFRELNETLRKYT